MFGKNKVHTVGTISEFMSGTWKEREKEERRTKLAAYSAAATTILSPVTAHANTAGEIMMNAFDPLIAMLQGASYPVAFIMISGGFLLIMMGQQSRGLRFIKWASLGYIGMQFAPAIMGMLHEIGVQMKGAK